LEAPIASLRGREFVVVGVARDAHWRGLIEAPDPMLYFPFGLSVFGGVLDPVLMIRSSRPVDQVRQSAQAIMTAVDSSMPAMYGGPLTAQIDGDSDISNRRVFAWALSMLSAVGVLLAGFGLAGLLAQIVSERTREFGIRLAIGARPSQLYALLIRHAAWIAGTGAVIGLAVAWFGSRLLESQLYGVSRFDPPTYAAAAFALALVVFLAAAWPGRRAARVNPVEALRAE
jgi:ABC-type antimicrobial peptide transport system permease subunit